MNELEMNEMAHQTDAEMPPACAGGISITTTTWFPGGLSLWS
jgi:hypothetical protein